MSNEVHIMAAVEDVGYLKTCIAELERTLADQRLRARIAEDRAIRMGHDLAKLGHKIFKQRLSLKKANVLIESMKKQGKRVIP